MPKRKINLIGSVDQEDILYSILNSDLTEHELADLAIRFGENGDFSYELILIEKLYKLFKSSYKNISDDDNKTKEFLDLFKLTVNSMKKL